MLNKKMNFFFVVDWDNGIYREYKKCRAEIAKRDPGLRPPALYKPVHFKIVPATMPDLELCQERKPAACIPGTSIVAANPSSVHIDVFYCMLLLWSTLILSKGQGNVC